MVALPARHRLAAKEGIALAALARDSFVLVPPDTAPILHDAVVRACREAGFVPHAPHEADDIELILGMVAAGRGVALVPACARRTARARVVCRSLRPPAPVIETALAWRRTSASSLVSEFVAFAQRVFGGSRSRAG